MSNPWKEKEAQDRKDAFLKAYDELTKKHGVMLGAFPKFVPSGQSGFSVVGRLAPINLRELNVPSPIQQDDLAS